MLPDEDEAVDEEIEHSEDFLEPRDEGELGGEHCCCKEIEGLISQL